MRSDFCFKSFSSSQDLDESFSSLQDLDEVSDTPSSIIFSLLSTFFIMLI